MPEELLAPTDDDRRPVAGFFGKLPVTGDFVARGLPEAFRRNWDAWLSRHILPRQRESGLPPGGLRFRLVSGGRLAAGLILPSTDSAGRLYPLSLILIAEGGLTQAQIDAWCDAALTLPVATLAPDALWLALDALPAPLPEGEATGPLQLWTPDQPPDPAGSGDPEDALNRLLSSG